MMKSILGNSRKHDISFHASGKIDISARIARRLSLASGDVIDIAREGNELFIHVKLRSGSFPGRHEGIVRSTSKGRGTYRCWSKAIVHAVFSLAGHHDCLRCPCGAELERDDTKYITIIYRLSL